MTPFDYGAVAQNAGASVVDRGGYGRLDERPVLAGADAGASRQPASPLRRIGLLLLFAFAVAACATSTRNKTLSIALTAVDASAAAFTSYNRSHQEALVDEAQSYDDGLSRLNAWHQQREPVLDSIRVAYRLIAAATLDKDASLADVIAAVESLVGAVEQLTGTAAAAETTTEGTTP